MIQSNHLSLECGTCRHWRLVAVSALIERLGETITAHEVARRSTCSKCGQRGVTFQILFVGASAEALGGARQDSGE